MENLPFTLALLPERQGGAAENMAVDFLLLKSYPNPEYARFRHYGWHRPAFTFGYSQKIGFVRENLPPGERVDLCRRATGGGLVDHRDDWTYALVIPRLHPLYDQPAPKSYHCIHEVMTKALVDLGEPVELKESCESVEGESCERGPTVCFTRAERFDVVHTQTGRKVAGAAQKRTRDGLLFQGSIERSALSKTLDWDALQEAFTQGIARALHATPEVCGWPDFPEGQLEALQDQYSEAEWNEFR